MKKLVILFVLTAFINPAFGGVVERNSCKLAVSLEPIKISPSYNTYSLTDADLDVLSQKGFTTSLVYHSEDASVLHLAWTQNCASDGLGGCTYKVWLRELITVGFPLLELEQSQERATLQEALQDLSGCISQLSSN